LCLALLVVAASCAPQAATPAPAVPTPALQPVSAQAKASIVGANNRFGLRLFAELAKQDAGKNVFLSPASVAMALAMTYNGALGETQQAMAQALELQGLSLDDVNNANAELRVALANPDPKVQLNIANSLWAKQGVPFRPEFVAANRAYYAAEVTNLDFVPGTIDTINRWVSEKTNGKIERIVDQLNPQSVLFLVNAIYFNGAWSEPFNAKATKPGTFTTGSGEKVTLPMMRRGGHFQYLQGEGFQAVSLPYGDGRVSLYIFLPDEGSSLDEFAAGLSAERWEQWLGQFAGEQGSLTVPRFTAEYGAELQEALTALGMGVAFDQARADFHGMIDTTQPVWIGSVKHKTFLALTEEGTEAAGATVVEMRAGSAPPQNPFSMVVDRPFFCAIRDNETGAVLFVGAIVEPS